MEILRRYYAGMVDRVRGKADDSVVRKLEIVMQQADVTPGICPAVAASLQVAESTGMPAGAMVLPDGRICHRQEQLPAGAVGGASDERH